jgi:hypothetical protein
MLNTTTGACLRNGPLKDYDTVAYYCSDYEIQNPDAIYQKLYRSWGVIRRRPYLSKGAHRTLNVQSSLNIRMFFFSGDGLSMLLKVAHSNVVSTRCWLDGWLVRPSPAANPSAQLNAT